MALNLATANIKGTGFPTSRTLGDRIADVMNVKDFGAKGDSTTDDTAAIQAAVTAMYAIPQKSCILYFPPGNYKITSTIDIGNHNGGSNNTSGIIRGAGRWSAYITGNIPTGFIFQQQDGVNGPEEISNLAFSNTSTVIGTGALYLANTTGGIVSNCNFGGMIGVFLPYNVFQTTIISCTGGSGSDPTTGHAGTFGILGFHCNVTGWRSVSNYQAGIQFYGSNSAKIYGCGIENCTAAYVAGMATGYATQCTVSGNTLTVGGTLATNQVTQFRVGSEIFMSGLTTAADWGKSPLDANRCVITGLGTGTGYAGTYTISRSATIASPVPCVSRSFDVIVATSFEDLASEGCYYIGFWYGMSGCTIKDVGGSATVNECVDAFGSTGYSATVGMYVYGGCGATSFVDCTPNNNPTLASWYFDPNGAPSHLSLLNCAGQRLADSVTGTTSSISNGSGGAGTILKIISLSPGFGGVGIGMKPTGAGVTAGTVVTRNYATDTQAISSYSYNSGTGLVTLTMAATQTIPNGWDIAISGLNIPGLNIVTTAVSVSGTTVTYTAPTSLVGSPSGGGTLHTLTGLSGIGTYGVNNSQLVTGTAITVKTGDDWILPTSDAAKTGVQLYNCNSANLPAGYTSGLANGLARTYASLPGNVGSNGNFPVQDGMEYPIVDSNTAVWGATVAGGGSNHVTVRYNGTNWTVMGK